MGYFKRKLDRGRTRSLQRALSRSARMHEDCRWLQLDSPAPNVSERRRYVRFATDRLDTTSGQPEGVFQAAYRIMERVDLHRTLADEIQSAIEWFERNLRAPQSVYRSAIFWYKLNDPQFLQKTWPLVKSLQRCDCQVKMYIARELPGSIDYEDSHQIAVVTYCDANFTVKSLPQPH